MNNPSTVAAFAKFGGLTLPRGERTTVLDEFLPRSVSSFLNTRFSLVPAYHHGSQRDIYEHPETNRASLDVVLLEIDANGRRVKDGIVSDRIGELVDRRTNGTTTRERWKIGAAEFEVDTDRRFQFAARRESIGVVELEGKRFGVHQARSFPPAHE